MASHSTPIALKVWFPIRASELTRNAAVKPVSMLIARKRWVASRIVPRRLIVIATKTRPASVADPAPTIRKKFVHCSGEGCAVANMRQS